MNKIKYQDKSIIKFTIESPKYGNKEVIIDAENWDKIKKYRWVVAYAKRMNTFYVQTKININHKITTLKLHRLIMNIDNVNLEIDHINHNPLDNREINLRICTHRQNLRNQRIRQKKEFKGIHWYKPLQKWQTHIVYNYKKYHLGYFENEFDAAVAYNRAAIKYFGEFAELNNV